MKILHLNLNFKVTSLYKHFSESLINNNCDISVYYPKLKDSYQNENISYLNEDPILNKYDRLFFYKRNNKILKNIKKQYNINDYNILHAHSLFSNGYLAYKLKKKFGIPYIVAVRNTDINVFFKKFIHMRSLGHKILEEAEVIICLSIPYKEELLEKYVPNKIKDKIKNKIIIIPNGIENYWLENKFKKESKNIGDKLKIISVGVINKNKNILTTVKACSYLIKKLNMDIELILVGQIKDEKYFKKIEKYSFVKHLPFQSKENLIQLYRKSHVFVMPSIVETFGLTYAEAMSQSLPIIYSKGQGFDRQFEEGIVGFGAKKKDRVDIAKKLLKIIEEYNKISKNSYELVDRYSWDKISKDYIEIYNEIIKRKKE